MFSINQYTANGSLLAQYVIDTSATSGVVSIALSVDVGGSRLFALKNMLNADSNDMIVWWNLTAAVDEQQWRTEGGVKQVEASVVHTLDDTASSRRRSRSREERPLTRAGRERAERMLQRVRDKR